MNQPSTIRPRLSVLTAEQIEQIHEYSLWILAAVGVRVDSPRARQLLRQALGSSADDERVRIPREQVEWALQAAPAMVDIYDRRGELAFRLGADRTRFGIGVTSLFYQHPLTDELTPFARPHMQTCVRLGHSLPLYDVISTIGIEQDVPPTIADLTATLDMLANTTKPLVVLISDEQLYPATLDMLEHLHGDLATRPFVIPYFNPLSPLIVNEGTADKMLTTIERGLPLIYSNYGMAGMSTPITAAGTLALLNAELLAGLVLSQVAREGAPIILGSLPNFFDMKTMVSFYEPQSMLLNLACAEMMAHYGLPHCGTSGSGTGWGPDLLAAETYWMNHLTSCMGPVGLCPFIGDTLGSKAFSPVNVLYVHEVIDQALRLAQGFVLDNETIGMDEIIQAGPGGDFLMSNLTLKNYRRAYFTSDTFPRWSLEKWQAEGSPRAEALLRQRTQQLLETLTPPDDHDELLARGEAWIAQM